MKVWWLLQIIPDSSKIGKGHPLGDALVCLDIYMKEGSLDHGRVYGHANSERVMEEDCFDPSHLARLGIDYLRALREFGTRVHHVHGKDTAISPEDLYLQGRLGKTFGAPAFKCSEGWWRYCVPGDGVVDWRAIAIELTALGKTDLCFSIELEDGCYMDDEAANKAGLLAAKAHLDSVLR